MHTHTHARTSAYVWNVQLIKINGGQQCILITGLIIHINISFFFPFCCHCVFLLSSAFEQCLCSAPIQRLKRLNACMSAQVQKTMLSPWLWTVLILVLRILAFSNKPKTNQSIDKAVEKRRKIEIVLPIYTVATHCFILLIEMRRNALIV